MTHDNINAVSDDDLTLLYYGEHDDPGLAARVAEDPALQQRFQELSAAMALADQWAPPGRDESYGSEVWQQISGGLQEKPATRGRIALWWGGFNQPRFSMAGAFSLVLVAALAFMVGRNGTQTGEINIPADQVVESAVAMAGIDATRLLTRSVSGHLTQVDQVLTNFANSSDSSANEAEWATDMLVANRLYRQAANGQGNTQLAAFLGTLEPLLIELAYEAHKASPVTRERMQAEVKEGLLFRVRVMNQQLQKPQSSI